MRVHHPPPAPPPVPPRPREPAPLDDEPIASARIAALSDGRRRRGGTPSPGHRAPSAEKDEDFVMDDPRRLEPWLPKTGSIAAAGGVTAFRSRMMIEDLSERFADPIKHPRGEDRARSR